MPDETLPNLDQPQPTPFATLFETLAAGTANADATAALAEVVQAVEDLGRAGKVLVELTVEPEGDSGRHVAIRSAVTAKPPRPKAAGSILFVGPGGSVHRNDPYQRQMFAREADEPTGDIREA